MVARRCFIGVLFAILALGVLASPAVARSGHRGPPVCGPYPPCPPPTAALSDAVASPGQTDTVHGNGWCPGATITVTLDGNTVATATVGRKGAFSTTFKIPRNESLGAHPVVVTGTAFGCSGPATVTLSVQVSRTPASASAFAPSTGIEIRASSKPPVRFADLGLVACAIGFFFLLFHRKIFPYHPRRSHPLRRLAWRLSPEGRDRM